MSPKAVIKLLQPKSTKPKTLRKLDRSYSELTKDEKVKFEKENFEKLKKIEIEKMRKY